nr:retrovirus-related Pol polyprotein from transposon TNT 1-94 [Tanacetum cinerariifolium]
MSLKTYTHYKTLLNELANDGVNLSKHKINVGFVNNLHEKWLTISQGPRNANHTQTLVLADIHGRFVYEDNLIQRRYYDTKKALTTTPSSFAISTAFFSNNLIQDFQENSDDEVDERSSEEYLRDLDVEYQERALLANSKHFIRRRNNFSGQKANENIKCYKCGNKDHFARDCFSKTSNPSYQSPVNNFSSVSKGFQPKFTPKLIWSSPNSNSKTNLKFQKDYKAECKKMKSKLALLKASPSCPQNLKTLQPKNKSLVSEIFDWDEKKVRDDEEFTQVKVLMALTDDELTVRKSHAQNGEWVDITIRKEQLKEKKKKKILRGELLTESLSKININENTFIPASIGYDQEMVLKIKDWVERLNPDGKLPNFNNKRILVPKSQAVNESLKTLNTPESSKDSEAEFLIQLPPLKNLQGASPSSEVMPLTFQPHSPKERPGLGIMKYTNPETHDSPSKSVLGTVTISETKILYYMICKRKEHMTSSHEMYIASFKKSKSYKAQSYQYASTSKKILKAKAKPFLPCTYYGFNEHRTDDCRNYLECEICGSYDHSTLGHNRVILIRGGVLAESSQSNESSIGRHIREPIWYLDNGCSKSTTGVKSYLYKYVDQPGPKVVFGDNLSCITEGYGSINYGVSPMSINHEKYTLVIVDEYSRNKRLLSAVEVTNADMEVTTAVLPVEMLLLLEEFLLLDLVSTRLRIEQYFQVQDYALWDVIENGNSFKPAAQTTTNADGTLTTLILGPVTTEEKVQTKNDVKARGMLLMALPNEHLMTFNQYKDAKTLFAAIQTRFGGNEAIKKTQKTLLMQMYDNFSAPSTESLDSIFNRPQKIRNKHNLDIISFDDLYNNFKIIKQEVKGTTNSSSSLSSQNMAFVSSPTSTNEVNTAYGDLVQIHEDDLEKIYLKWQLALLSMRTRRQPKNQDSRNRNQDSSRRTVNVEETASKEMVAIDGAIWQMMKLDLSNSGLKEFQQPEFEGQGIS